MTLRILAMCMLLSGCVTVVVPPNNQTPTAPPVVIEKVEGTVGKCPPYRPPTRAKLPQIPQISKADGTYVQYLEALSEKLARYAGALRDYIEDEHAAEDQALFEYRLACE